MFTAITQQRATAVSEDGGEGVRGKAINGGTTQQSGSGHPGRASGWCSGSVVGEMAVGFVRDTSIGRGVEGMGAARLHGVDTDSDAGPHYWWKTPFVYVYVISPTGPHDHKVVCCSVLQRVATCCSVLNSLYIRL